MIWWTKRGFYIWWRRIFPYFSPTGGSALKIWAPSGPMVRRPGSSFVISKYCAFLPFHRVKSIKGSCMHAWQWEKELKSQWVVIIIIIPFEVKDINIFRVFCGDGGGRGGGGGYHRKAHPCAEHCKANMMIIFLKPLKTQNLDFLWLEFLGWFS